MLGRSAGWWEPGGTTASGGLLAWLSGRAGHYQSALCFEMELRSTSPDDREQMLPGHAPRGPCLLTEASSLRWTGGADGSAFWQTLKAAWLPLNAPRCARS